MNPTIPDSARSSQNAAKPAVHPTSAGLQFIYICNFLPCFFLHRVKERQPAQELVKLRVATLPIA